MRFNQDLEERSPKAAMSIAATAVLPHNPFKKLRPPDPFKNLGQKTFPTSMEAGISAVSIAASAPPYHSFKNLRQRAPNSTAAGIVLVKNPASKNLQFRSRIPTFAAGKTTGIAASSPPHGPLKHLRHRAVRNSTAAGIALVKNPASKSLQFHSRTSTFAAGKTTGIAASTPPHGPFKHFRHRAVPNSTAAGIALVKNPASKSLQFRSWTPTFAAGKTTGITAAAPNAGCIFHIVVWKKPTLKWIKVNCDATVKDGIWWVSCVIRDKSGDVLLAAGRPAHHAARVKEAELEGLIFGVEMVLLHHPVDFVIWLENDNVNVIKLIPPIFVSAAYPKTDYENRVFHLKKLLENRRVRISFAYRQENFPADKVVSLAAEMGGGMTVIYDLSTIDVPAHLNVMKKVCNKMVEIKQHVKDDKNGKATIPIIKGEVVEYQSEWILSV